MSELTDIIKGRRSVRSFIDQMPYREDIDAVVEAGLYAASGRGMQSTRIIVITDRELRDRIAEVNGKIMNAPEGFDPFYNAPVILMVIAEKERGTAVYDGSLSLGNMMLKAHERGLGTCWIHRAKEEMEMEIGREILERAGLEGEYIGVGHLALGYAKEFPMCPARKEGRAVYI